MAIRKLGPSNAPDAVIEKLKNAIKDEIRRPENQASPPGAPKVFKEESGFPPYYHYYVIWDGFDGIDPEDRSKAIYQAIKEECGQEEALKTTVAMGLTRQEAPAVGLSAAD